MNRFDLAGMNTTHTIESHGFGNPHRFSQCGFIAHITEDSIDGLDSSGTCSIDQHGAGKKGLFPIQGSLGTDISSIVLQAHS